MLPDRRLEKSHCSFPYSKWRTCAWLVAVAAAEEASEELPARMYAATCAAAAAVAVQYKYVYWHVSECDNLTSEQHN